MLGFGFGPQRGRGVSGIWNPGWPEDDVTGVQGNAAFTVHVRGWTGWQSGRGCREMSDETGLQRPGFLLLIHMLWVWPGMDWVDWVDWQRLGVHDSTGSSITLWPVGCALSGRDLTTDIATRQPVLQRIPGHSRSRRPWPQTDLHLPATGVSNSPCCAVFCLLAQPASCGWDKKGNF